MKIIVGKTDDNLCLVAALLTYLTVRGSHPGPLFVWKSDTTLSKIKFVEEVRLALEAVHLPVSDFSFRIGATSTPASAILRLCNPDSWALEKLSIPPVHY